LLQTSGPDHAKIFEVEVRMNGQCLAMASGSSKKEAEQNAARAAIYDSMNATLAALHDIDVAAVGLGDFGKPGNYFERQFGRWTGQYHASETGSVAEMDRLIAWLGTHMPADDGQVALVHGDYRLDNMIFAPNAPSVLAVLDWELSTLGDPLADFSYHTLTWHLKPEEFRGMAGADLATLGIPFERDYLALYCARVGRPPVPEEVWDFYLVYNLFRLAAILQGIAKRVEDGTAASATARETGAKARPIAELAWRWAQDRLDAR
jgi:aminoglycoside phosphotransferase (APT) family kinase protein